MGQASYLSVVQHKTGEISKLLEDEIESVEKG
jgi:hypothetical protein